MKTDQLIYQFLATGAEAFRVLTGTTLIGPYQFSAPVLKGVERRIDALFEPQGHLGPVYVVEFQAQMQPSAWYNLLAKVGLYGEKHPKQQVRGILIFPYRAIDNQDMAWIRTGIPGLLSVVYLDEFLPELLIEDSHNPFWPCLLHYSLKTTQSLSNKRLIYGRPYIRHSYQHQYMRHWSKF